MTTSNCVNSCPVINRPTGAGLFVFRSLKKSIYLLINILLLSLFLISNSYSNNLSIENVVLGARNPSSSQLTVGFDLSWDNSWKTKINHDAAWVTVWLSSASQNNVKKLCGLTESGVNPQGTSTGIKSDNNVPDIEIAATEDKKGAFIRPSEFGNFSSVSNKSLQLTVDYSSCGFSANDNIKVSVLGMEMVYIPSGAFYAGDFDASTASLDQGSADLEPWYISGELAISVSNPAANGFRYVSNSNPGEDATGTAFIISEDFPKGYNAFYTMKYEITEGQWVEFINSLDPSARVNHDLTDNSHKATDTVVKRNTISCSGSPLVCSTQRPFRALSYLSWMDLAAFLDWAALRPMTELEFEKISRGPVLPVEGEFAWGTTNITSAASIGAGDENGSETVENAGANAHFNSSVLTGGDTGYGAEYQSGPVRSGIFSKADSTRESAGASYYGVMEISGNVKEPVVTIGNSLGRNFTGIHGDGNLTTASGSEGNANQSNWPGLDALIDRGVTSADGSGFRGGAWDDQLSAQRLRISDRYEAARSDSGAYNNTGGRGVRSEDEN